MDITTIKQQRALTLNDSLPVVLERLIISPGVDWSGKLIGRSEYKFKPIPVIEKTSDIYSQALKWSKILQEALLPANPKHIFMHLTNLRVHFKSHSLSETESRILIQDYISDYQFAPSFKEKTDILRFHRPYKILGIKKDEYLTIKKVNHISNSLILKKANGKEVLFQLRKEVDYKSKFEVFHKLALELQQGLKIIFTKNNQTLGFINSETATIKSINKNIAILQFENKMTKDIPMSQLKHIDYGYCITVHTSQGKTFDNTIAAIGKNALLNNQQSWLVSLSRHRVELSILSEDMKSLKTYLSHNTGQEMSALELVSKTEFKKADQIDKNTQVNKSQIMASI